MERELLLQKIEMLKALRAEYALLQERLADATTSMETILEEIETLLS